MFIAGAVTCFFTPIEVLISESIQLKITVFSKILSFRFIADYRTTLNTTKLILSSLLRSSKSNDNILNYLPPNVDIEHVYVASVILNDVQ